MRSACRQDRSERTHAHVYACDDATATRRRCRQSTSRSIKSCAMRAWRTGIEKLQERHFKQRVAVGPFAVLSDGMSLCAQHQPSNAGRRVHRLEADQAVRLAVVVVHEAASLVGGHDQRCRIADQRGHLGAGQRDVVVDDWARPTPRRRVRSFGDVGTWLTMHVRGAAACVRDRGAINMHARACVVSSSDPGGAQLGACVSPALVPRR